MKKADELQRKKEEFLLFLSKSNITINLQGSNDDFIRSVVETIPTRTSVWRTTFGLRNNPNKDNAKGIAYDYLCSSFKTLLSGKVTTADQYDKWFKDTCAKLVGEFNSKTGEELFRIGHAQKWISMSMKYFFCFGKFPDFHYEFCHCPIDQNINDTAFRMNSENGNKVKFHEIKKAQLGWSKISDFEKLDWIYEDIDELIKALDLGCSPLEFDVLYWEP